MWCSNSLVGIFSHGPFPPTAKLIFGCCTHAMFQEALMSLMAHKKSLKSTETTAPRRSPRHKWRISFYRSSSSITTKTKQEPKKLWALNSVGSNHNRSCRFRIGVCPDQFRFLNFRSRLVWFLLFQQYNSLFSRTFEFKNLIYYLYI